MAFFSARDQIETRHNEQDGTRNKSTKISRTLWVFVQQTLQRTRKVTEILIFRPPKWSVTYTVCYSSEVKGTNINVNTCVCVCVCVCFEYTAATHVGGFTSVRVVDRRTSGYSPCSRKVLRSTNCIKACCGSMSRTKAEFMHAVHCYVAYFSFIHTYITYIAYIHKYIHTYIRTYMHTYIHTYIYTYIHT